MDVSVIIVNYNTKGITEKCIESVQMNTRCVDYEIILIDNASSDGSREIFEKRKDIIYIYLDNNVGFGKANNIGLTYATGNYIFLLNSDTILINDAISFFYAYAQQHKGWGCLGSQLLDLEKRPIASFGYFLTIPRVLYSSILSYLRLIRPFNPIVSLQSNDAYEVEVVLGADLFIKRGTIDNYGFFDPSYFMYHEENDLMRTYYENGLKQYIIPGPQIIHLESQSTKISIAKKIMTIRSLFIYVKKWNRRFSYFIFRLLYGLLKFPFVFSRGLTLKNRGEFLKALFCWI